MTIIVATTVMVCFCVCVHVRVCACVTCVCTHAHSCHRLHASDIVCLMIARTINCVLANFEYFISNFVLSTSNIHMHMHEHMHTLTPSYITYSRKVWQMNIYIYI